MKRQRWAARRREPYTTRGIRRLGCIRCGQPASCQWNICADGNVFRPLCQSCDVALNALVLEWMHDPEAAAKLARYQASLRDAASTPR